jgi:ATP-binding cassette subfamily B protein
VDDLLPFERELALRGVGFSYPTADKPALECVDLVIRKGERVGFVGTTGSGKSTLIDLVMGLLEPDRGTLLVDDVALDDQNRARWQGRIAHVPQSIFLSDNSIAANIAFGEEAHDIDLERIREAARAAQIDDYVMSLPEGYATGTGERGIQLSGGQRQRIGIARALYKGADVLILDEATSALDEATEAAVIAALSDVDRRLTVLMIAHRLSTLESCDKLVQLEGGRVARIGRYREVVTSLRMNELGRQAEPAR